MLLQRGKVVLDELFPGFIAELESRGAEVADASKDVKWFHRGMWKRRFETGSYTHFCSRGLLDLVVRERLQRNPIIEMISNARVSGLLHDARRGAVTGVELVRGGEKVQLHADLVVDASGRGSQSDRWLAELCGQEVRKSEVVARLGYASRIYERRPEYAAAWKVMIVLPKIPESRRLGVLVPLEGNRWMLTTGGWLGECPGDSDGELLDFLRSLPSPALYEVVRGARPLSDISIYRMPGSLRRHFEEVEHWPGGFLVMGDAMCSLNPIYGQGMTVSAMQAQLLGEELEAMIAAMSEGPRGGAATRALQRKLAAQAQVPWDMVQSEDLRFPEIEGPRGWRLKVQQKMGSMVVDAAAIDPVVCKKWLDVLNLMVPPQQLMDPRIQARVLAATARLRLLRPPETAAEDVSVSTVSSPRGRMARGSTVTFVEERGAAGGADASACPEPNAARADRADRIEPNDQREPRASTEPGTARNEKRAATEPGSPRKERRASSEGGW